MPKEPLSYKPLGIFRNKAGLKVFGYSITIGDETFARYYRNPRSQSLAWRARYNTNDIESLAFEWFSINLSNPRTSPLTLESPGIKQQLKVYFLHQNSDTPSPARLSLSERSDYDLYAHFITNMQPVSFIRYDLEQSHDRYTFTAEGPARSATVKQPYLGVAIPPPRRFTPSKIDWVLSRHATINSDQTESSAVAHYIDYLYRHPSYAKV